jgi:hypothetical protein
MVARLAKTLEKTYEMRGQHRMAAEAIPINLEEHFS